jgi:beta-mannosidase
MARRRQDLNGEDWQLGCAPAMALPNSASWGEIETVTEWLPAVVPGNVRADLLRAGRLPDLTFGTGFEASRWVDDHCWWLVRDLDLQASATERVHLVLRGVDYIADLFLNGHHLGRHEGMFSPQVHEITRLLQSKNRLAIRLLGSRWLPEDRSSPWERLLNQIEARLGAMPAVFPHRRDTLKCQMGFGWDFAPPLLTMGIWDDVYALACEGVFLRDIVARTRLRDGGATLQLDLELDADRPRTVRIEASLVPDSFSGQPTTLDWSAELLPGPNCCRAEMEVAEPRLWWPWDHGRPDLYRLTVRLLEGEKTLDAESRLVGLCQMALEAQGDRWTLRVNGQPVYARGANWVPASILAGQVRDQDYHRLLATARQGNMNMLRVWGGGLRERPAFYDLCDRLGILVWQEFPFACAFLTRFPRSRAYLDLVDAEARAIVRDLRGHPSLALWCGGNEFSPERNAPLVATLRRAVAQEDPGRAFVPASPAAGDSHRWQVWHGFQPPSTYRQDEAAFASEFGLQAPPAVDTLRRFIPRDELWPPGQAWITHGAGLHKLWRYARPFLPADAADLEAWVEASQRAQAQGLQIAIEHYRRRKARGNGGALVWQLNEPWPAISWALLDFYGQPKPAYEVVRRAFSPLLISLEFPLAPYQVGDDLEITVWLINDRPEPAGGCQVEVQLWNPSGQPVERFVHPAGTNAGADTVSVPGAGVEAIAHFRWPLAWPTAEGSGGRLTCRLWQGSSLLAANEYDLGPYDGILPTWRQRLWARLTGLVTPS